MLIFRYDDYSAASRIKATFEPLDKAFVELHEHENIRTPVCIEGTEGVVVFQKREV